MTVRLHLIEDSAKHLSASLTEVLLRHVAIQRAGGLDAREITASILTGFGVAGTSALKACIVFGVPGGREAMYDEAVKKLTGVLVESKPEALACVEKLGR